MHLLNGEFDPAFKKRAIYIAEEIQKYSPQTILDIGCGRGFYEQLCIQTLPSVKKVIGIDINTTYLAQAQNINKDRRVSFHKIRATTHKLPFSSQFFDCVICTEVLEHLPNDKLFLHEYFRVLKKGGILIITVPHKHFPFLWDPINWILSKFNTHINKNIWWLAGIWADHERLYTKKQIEKMLNSSLSTITSFGQGVSWCWPFSHFILYGIGKNLVEKMNNKMVSRFSFKKKSFIVRVLASIFCSPSTILDPIFPLSASSNLFFTAKKK